MNDAQLQQLIGVIRQGGGGGHKTSKFSSAEGTEWRIWRRNFVQTLLINGWNNKRCQREAAAALESTAAEFTSDIPGFVAGRDIQVLLNLYETRFLPAAGGAASCCAISEGCSDGRGADRRLARKVAQHLRASLSWRKNPKLETPHQQIRLKTSRLKHPAMESSRKSSNL
jgi:hypothetical protein